MLLTCENCRTVFRIAPAKLSPKGQQVRCSVCAHRWMAIPASQTDEAPDNNHKVKTNEIKTGKIMQMLRLPVAVLSIIIALSASFVASRGVVTAYFPSLIPSYDLIGLTICADIKQLEVQDLDADYSGDSLQLRGKLANISRYRAHSAPLLVRLEDQDGQLIATSRVIPDARFIDAGDKTDFFVQLDIPTDRQVEISITPLAERVILPTD